MTRKRAKAPIRGAEAPEDNTPQRIPPGALMRLGRLLYDRDDFAGEMSRELGLERTAIYQAIHRANGVSNQRGMVDKIMALVQRRIRELNSRATQLATFDFESDDRD